MAYREHSKSGERNAAWKGNKAGYRAIHYWVIKRLGKPNKCSECGFTSKNSRQFNWANVSGKYKRELSDWKRLCVSCHRKFDFNEERRQHASTTGKIGAASRWQNKLDVQLSTQTS